MNEFQRFDASLCSIESLGFSSFFAAQFESLADREQLVAARVIADHRGVYELAGCAASSATLAGRLRHALDSESLPVAGDWVAVDARDDATVIRAVLSRRTSLRRKVAGSRSRAQVLAANVDVFFVVTACGGDLNPRRLERYLAAVRDGGATAVVVLNKVDLADATTRESSIEAIRRVSGDASVVAVSALAGRGLDELEPWLARGSTVGFVGSSGVGKSSLVNALTARARSETDHGAPQSVGAVDPTGRGTHTTTARALVSLGARGWLMDTPGMRELGSVGESEGLSTTFGEIESLAARCRFRDCSHDREPGCAVRDAIEEGTLEPERLASYEKLAREAASAATRRDRAALHDAKRAFKARSKQQRAHYKLKNSS